ncbi:MAG: thrombospondin type 3 repeat-containing protein [Myxococcales bacterium]|nr:MAG: thrombospondin type 3 repeat-containing protein [Myxococcales bacterium]
MLRAAGIMCFNGVLIVCCMLLASACSVDSTGLNDPDGGQNDDTLGLDTNDANSSSEDSDSDGVLDSEDNCLTVANANQLDTDGDTIGNACDNCFTVANYDQSDADQNGLGDACTGTLFATADDDEDGVLNYLDNCVLTPNIDQLDTDQDSIGDLCDNCRYIANTDQVDANHNGVGDVCQSANHPNDDSDGDGKSDDFDNCPELSNPSQSDSDGDGIGDACDSCLTYYDPSDACNGVVFEDADGDGMSDGEDRCPLISGSAGDANHLDPDNDNIGSGCDNCPDTYNPGQEIEYCQVINPAEACQSASSDTNVIAPNLVFVIDESGSMDGSREDTWETALAPVASSGGGLAEQLSNGNYNLAASHFAGSNNCSAFPTTTMQLSTPTNFSTLNPSCAGSYATCFESAANLNPSGSTPTPAALQGVLNGALYELNGNANTDPDSARRAKAVLLVTDGVPTACPDSGTNNTGPLNNTMRATISAALALARTDTDPDAIKENFVPVYVLGFDNVNVDMMQLMANAGDPGHFGPYQLCDTNNGYNASGDGCICNDGTGSQSIVNRTPNNTRYRPTGCIPWNSLSKSDWFSISDVNSIVSAVASIVARTASCELTLAGAEPGNPDLVTVQLAGDSTATQSFSQDASNGYTLSGSDLTLNGTACETLESAVMTDATARVEVLMACACTLNEESCDNIDNDCDGYVDEGCSTSPNLSCEDVHGSSASECCMPTAEICNSVDDDCDSEIDEGCTAHCQAFSEVCDGVDNNCNNQIDEGCISCTIPSNEVCDGLDNDCDGTIDEGCGPGPDPVF